MTHINHIISKELVQFSKDFGIGLRFEDLYGCRKTMKQRKTGVILRKVERVRSWGFRESCRRNYSPGNLSSKWSIPRGVFLQTGFPHLTPSFLRQERGFPPLTPDFSRQKKKTKSDSAENRDDWAYYQLEQFTRYKAIREAISVESVPAQYTSKFDHCNGMLGVRNRNWFRGFDGYHANADWNASQNIGQWVGFSCPLDLQETVAAMAVVDAEGAVNGSPLTSEAFKMVASPS